jgi:hypothetical protein
MCGDKDKVVDKVLHFSRVGECIHAGVEAVRVDTVEPSKPANVAVQANLKFFEWFGF